MFVLGVNLVTAFNLMHTFGMNPLAHCYDTNNIDDHPVTDIICKDRNPLEYFTALITPVL